MNNKAAILIVYLVFCATLIFAQTPEVSPNTGLLANPIWEVLRTVGGIIGMVGGALAAIAAWKFAAKKQVIESQDTTIRIYEKEIAALKKENETNAALLVSQSLTIQELRGRTDLSTVIKTMGDFIKSSEARYIEGMKLVKESFAEIVNEQKQSNAINQTSITRSEALSRRLGELEILIRRICDQAKIDTDVKSETPGERRTRPR